MPHENSLENSQSVTTSIVPSLHWLNTSCDTAHSKHSQKRRGEQGKEDKQDEDEGGKGGTP